MASITDAILQENEDLFNRLGPNPFTDSLSGNSTMHETAESRIIEPRDWLSDGALDDILLFADTIRPPVVVTSLPALPDPDYPVGSFAFLTTDAKLYRNTDGSTWSVAVDGTDIVANSITAGQIAAGAIGTTELAADAVIANVLNVGGTVTIDDTGITITDGALVLSDQFGTSVITGAGFGASWLDFVATGFYNSHFQVGTTTNITAATIVGGADTSAEYLSSLSADIPYWVVGTESGAGTLKRVSDSNAVGGYALQFDGNEAATVFQDVPVIPGQTYIIFINWRHTGDGSNTFTLTAAAQFCDADHLPLGSLQESGILYDTTQSTYANQALLGTDNAPVNARYLRVGIEFGRDSGSPTAWINTIALEPRRHYGDLYLGDGTGNFALVVTSASVTTIVSGEVAGDSTPRFSLYANGKQGWGSGSAAQDTFLRRSAAKTITIDTDGAGGALTTVNIVATNLQQSGTAVSLLGHGAADHANITRKIWLPAGIAGLDAGTAATKGTSPKITAVVALADGVNQGAYWNFAMPADSAGGAHISVQPIWAPGSTDASSHAVRWSISGQNRGSGSDITATGANAQFTGAAAARTANIIVEDTDTDAGFTPSGSLVSITIQRAGGDAADTYVGVVNLLGILVSYPATQ